MLVGLSGRMGTGKTLSMSILASYIALKTEVPLYANYTLYNSSPIQSLRDLWDIDTAVVCLDEIWLSMDSRLWKDNVKVTRWINQTRKKSLIVFYTTQHMSQVELRVRNATDVVIMTDKNPFGHWLTFLDYQFGLIGRKYFIDRPERFYSLYDTFETLKPLKV